MQTTEQKCLACLTERGMFKAQAREVFAQAKQTLEADDNQVIWDCPADEYPDSLYLHWFLILQHEALTWIDAHCPRAWFRPLFTPDPVAEIERLKSQSA